ncbi:MAG: esterase/lipase family protein [Myxococcota bacterium]
MARSLRVLAPRTAALLLAAGAVAACSAVPVRVEPADPALVQREVTSNELNSEQPSVLSLQVLQRLDLYSKYQTEPVRALAELRVGLAGSGDRYRLFALSELSYAYAEKSHDRTYYLAAAVYAYALLFSEVPSEAPLDPSDPRLRVACDLYNRGLAESFEKGPGGEIALTAGTHPLPFGSVEIGFDPSTMSWGGYHLEHLVPAADLEVHGLRNRYRRAGIGAPLVAGLWREDTDRVVAGHRRIPNNLKVPVTAFLRLENPRANVITGQLRGTLEIYSADDQLHIDAGQRDWPLEIETSSALAYTLGESRWWNFELAGFFSAAVNPWYDRSAEDGLLLVHPYVPGRIPLVLVHGTASSPARWADLINELEIDDRIVEGYQIWLYIYNTGNPIGYSAGVMRDSLERAVHELDPDGKDPALQKMVIVGHSQGGLLTKLTVVDSGLRFWHQATPLSPEELKADPETLEALRNESIFAPEPFVKRVVFVCTPQRGSYLASMTLARITSSLIQLPSAMTKRMADVASLNPGKIAMANLDSMPTSIDNMTPGSHFIQALAALPIAPGVHVHSIIAVDGDGPLEDASDGVVRYSSAHIAGVDSEKIVRSGHSAQGNPETIEEIRRILLLHLQEQ